MKIVHIIIGLNVGGAEMMLKRLVLSNHANSSCRHIVVSLTDEGTLGAQLQAGGVEVHRLGMHSLIGVPLIFWKLVHLIRELRPDIIQTWMYHADLLGGLAARLAGNRNVVWGVRTTDLSDGSSMTVIVRKICAWLSRWIPQVIVCAAEASRQSHIVVGYDAKKMVVVPNGYDFAWLQASLGERNALRKQWGIQQDELIVGSLGRFHSDKNQEHFIQAADLLASRFPQLRFVMAGRGVDSNNLLLMDWIGKTSCRERFILLGERKDVPQCLTAMDIFCLHSRTEGFPNALAEAMAMGLPCVTTDVGDAAMLLSDAGIVVPSEDPIALANGVEQLLGLQPEAMHALGLKAKARVESEYSIVRAQERFEEIYSRMLHKGAH